MDVDNYRCLRMRLHVGGAIAEVGDKLVCSEGGPRRGVDTRSQCGSVGRCRVDRLASQRETKNMMPHALCEFPGNDREEVGWRGLVTVSDVVSPVPGILSNTPYLEVL